MLLISRKSSGITKKSFHGSRKSRSRCASPCGNCGVKETEEGPRHRRAVYVSEGYLCNACYWYSKRHDGQSRPLHLIMQHGAKASVSPNAIPRQPVVKNFDVAEAMLKLKLSAGSGSHMVSPPNPILLNIDQPRTAIKLSKPIERPVWTATAHWDACDCIEMIPDEILERNLILNKMSAQWDSVTKDLSKEEILASLALLGYRKHHQ